ncbi:MAG TPA: glutamate--tRNA ligase, partial [Actinomycetota bacterium]|nr:glutamate--tRNA ligase [Actinomycetota bacterium]
MTDGGTVRCRIAPAPTGYLHVGNARAALFNWLFARHHGGVFVLRVEDTDLKRSTEEAIGIIISSLRWLGLDWDEGPEVGGDFGPYRQTEALEGYQQTARRLIDQGKAYVCYDTPDELEERRRAALARGQKPGYDGRCRNLSEEERRRFEAEGRPQAIRFAMPGEDVTVNDLIRGEVHFGADDFSDFVILRSDGTPTYLLAAAVDDVRMKMTHVIRGEDLLPSTPRQLEIIDALGADPPAYAHLPLIMGPDHRPLSKRHGAVAVEWFRERGFLPEAMVNYLALLGWSFDAETTF